MGSGREIRLQERIAIKHLLNQKYSLSQIARKIGRPKNTVVNEVKRYGGKEHYDPYTAQEKAETKKNERYQRLSDNMKGIQPVWYENLCNKVSCLEFHMDILLDEIRKLKEKK